MSLLLSCGFHSSFGPPRCYAVCHTFHVASIHLLVHQGAMLSVIRFMWLPFIFWSTKVLCCLSYVSCGFHSSFGPPRCYAVCHTFHVASIHLLVHQGAMLSVIRFMWLPFIFWSTKVLCCLSYVSCGFHSSFGPPRCYAVCHTFHVASIHLLVHQGAMLSVIRFMWLPFIFWSTKVLCCLSYVSCGFHSSFGPPRCYAVCHTFHVASIHLLVHQGLSVCHTFWLKF